MAEKEAILPVEKIQAWWGNKWIDSRDFKILDYNHGRNSHIAAHPCAAQDST